MRELREAAGLSRKQLADRAGLRSEAGIRDLEQGRRSPTWETVVALCKALGVTADSFLKKPTAPVKRSTGGRPRRKPPSGLAGATSS
ncbi:MAG: helix-turn-helix domain-containing protein [Gemmataceae bacterium]|nr:helix-turn-helix domain-containing protein [Gemmataceae bacterium]